MTGSGNKCLTQGSMISYVDEIVAIVRFLDARATIDLIEKKSELYRNLPVTQTFLSEDYPGYLGKLFRMTERVRRFP